MHITLYSIYFYRMLFSVLRVTALLNQSAKIFRMSSSIANVFVVAKKDDKSLIELDDLTSKLSDKVNIVDIALTPDEISSDKLDEV